MLSSSAKRLALALGVTVLACCVQVGTAGAQGSMPEGSYVCKPISAENLLQPPPIRPPDLSPEEQAYADANKLPPDLCPPGMIAYPVPSWVDELTGPMKSGPPPMTDPAESEPELAEPKKKAKPKTKAKKAKAQAKRKKAKAKAKKRHQAKSKAASRHQSLR